MRRLPARHLSLRLALAGAAGALFAACTSPCMEVQRTLCACEGQTQNERSACEDRASAQERLQPPTDAQQQACAQLADSCTQLVVSGCDKLQTPAGRAACGLSGP